MNQEPAQRRIRVILLDAQALLRVSLAGFLSSQPGLEVVGGCSSPGEALEILRASEVDVALLDFGRGGEAGGAFISATRRSGYHGRFLIVAETADARRSAAAMKSGASGIFLKSDPPARLVEAIRIVAAGGVWLDPKVVRDLAEELVNCAPQPGNKGPLCALTDREQEVLLGILGGLTSRRIGANLGLSEGSIKASVRQLFRKTGVRRRSQLVRVAIEGSLSAVEGKSALS